jgi:hypothetical protein
LKRSKRQQAGEVIQRLSAPEAGLSFESRRTRIQRGWAARSSMRKGSIESRIWFEGNGMPVRRHRTARSGMTEETIRRSRIGGGRTGEW